MIGVLAAGALLVGGVSATSQPAAADSTGPFVSSSSTFVHIATFDVTAGNGSDVAEIVDTSSDGTQLTYADSETGRTGFVDITKPSDPQRHPPLPHRRCAYALLMTGEASHGTWWPVVGALLALSTLGLGACGGGPDTAVVGDTSTDASAVSAPDVDIDGRDFDASSEGGSDDMSGGDFAIPAPDGLVLDALVDSGLDLSGQRQLYYDDDDFDRVVAFYDDWTSQDGEWVKSEIEGTVTFQGFETDNIRLITITSDFDPGAQADGPVTYLLLVAGE